MATSLKGKVVFITGATRGIGLAIAKRVAQDGASVVIAAKSVDENPKLPGTIYSASKECEALGGKALPVQCDIRSEESVANAVNEAVKKFGGIDVLVNNASAIWVRNTLDTPVKKYDLMNQVNGRGTWLCSKICLPHLIESAKKGRNPHVLTLSPPLSMKPQWFGPHTAYTIAKYSMSMCVLGLAEEFKDYGIAVNALWPRTTISTAAISFILNDEALGKCRTPEIMGDAAHAILTKKSSEFTGKFCMDDNVLRSVGVKDLSKYAAVPGTPDSALLPDFFLDTAVESKL